jgi:hypothetical protein
LLLERRRAVVARMHSFTIRLKARVGGALQPVRIKFDPRRKTTTGIALVRVGGEGQYVLWLTDLAHRGSKTSEAPSRRKGYRRRWRSVNLCFRAPRFENRTRAPRRLAPSLRNRVQTATTWTDRLCWVTPVSGLAVELVRFDLQQAQGVDYQQRMLDRFEVSEYLLA